jgi:transcriptional regulator with XRE-family HTH domain
MQIPIHSVQDLGLALRAVRRSQKVRLEDMAALTGVSKQFASDVELGKETVRLGLVLKVLAEMGLRVSVDIPEQSGPELALLQAKLASHSRKKTSVAAAGH